MNEPQAIIRIDRANRELAEAKSIDDIKDIRDKAQAIAQYLKQSNASLEAQNRAVELKIMAERRGGEMIIAMQESGQLATRGQPKEIYHDGRLRLSEIGLNYMQSSRWKLIAEFPLAKQHQHTAISNNGGKELTSASYYRIARRYRKEQEQEQEAERLAELETSLPKTHHEQCFYQDDLTQIWWGDARDLHFIEDNRIDLIVTSPPYNIGPKEGNGRILWGGVKYPTSDDKKPEEKYQDEQIEALDELWRVTRPGGSLFYNHKIRNRKGIGIHPLSWILKSKWTFRQQIIWDRGSTHNHEMTYFWPIDELIFWLTKGTKDVYLSPEGAQMTTIWRFNFDTHTDHPAPFPEELVMRCVRAASKQGDLVLDPFGGSFTTCIVAKKMKRHSIGVDIEKQYVVKYAARCSQGILL
jgi:modification methylase